MSKTTIEAQIREKIDQFAHCMIEREILMDKEDFAEATLQAAKRADELVEIVNNALTTQKEEVVKEILKDVKGIHVMAKTAYESNSWDAGVHDTLFMVEKKLVRLLSHPQD